jgi:hypothetical protein
MRAALILGVLLVGCGGENAAGDPGVDASNKDAGVDAPVEAGPCDPTGDWTWTFQAEAGTPQLDQVKIETVPDAGSDALKVTFLDRAEPKDTCMPPADGGADAGPEFIEALGSFNAATCTLSVAYSRSWCFSGESQCEDWNMSLMFSGNTGDGSATRVGGWCMDKHTSQYTVTATKP